MTSAVDLNDAFMIGGNHLADLFAKKGADCHPKHEAHYNDIKSASKLTQQVCKYIAQAACHFARDNKIKDTDRLELVPKATSGEVGDDSLVPGAHLSIYCTSLKRYRCKRCLRTSASPLTGSNCKESWEDNGHSLLAVGSYMVCLLCGGFASTHPVKLLKRCERKPAQQLAPEAKSLLQGLHPYHKTFIATPVPWKENAMHGCSLLAGASWAEDMAQTVDLGDEYPTWNCSLCSF